MKKFLALLCPVAIILATASVTPAATVAHGNDGVQLIENHAQPCQAILVSGPETPVIPIVMLHDAVILVEEVPAPVVPETPVHACPGYVAAPIKPPCHPYTVNWIRPPLRSYC